MRAGPTSAWFWRVTAVAVVLGMTGCSNGEVSGSIAARVTTEVSPATIPAGATSVTTCRIYDAKDREVVGLTSFTVAPEEGRELFERDITPTVAGEYLVQCASPEFELTDATGAILTVEPSTAVKITTIIDEPEVDVFEATEVTCVVTDEFGNVISVETVVAAAEGVEIDDHLVSAPEVGTYEITCRLADPLLGTEHIPADLEVTPADPATVELVATPDKDTYFVDQVVTLSWTIRDAYDNKITDIDATLEVPADNTDAIDEPNHKYQLHAEGLYLFTVRLEEPFELVTDSVTLVVDETGPVIDIPWPARGETVLGQGDFLVIEGTVTDAFGDIDFFEIDGIEVDVLPDGSFEALMLPQWGVNIIDAWAFDVFGNGSKLSPSFSYSASYLDYEGAGMDDVKQVDGAELLVGQEFLDDGDHDHSNPDDLATIMEVLLGDLDIVDLIGGFGGFPLLQQPLNLIDFDLGILKVKLGGSIDVAANIVEPTDVGPTMVTIDSRVGGIDSLIELGDAETLALLIALEIEASINASLEVEVFGNTLDLFAVSAGITTSTQFSLDSLLLSSKIDIQKAPGGELIVDIVQIDTEFTNLLIDPIQDVVIDFLLGDLPFGIPDQSFSFPLSQLVDINTLTDQFLDPLTTGFLPLLTDLITPFIEEFADGILVQLLEALELELPIPLPELLGPKPEPMELIVGTDISSIEFTDDGGQIGLSLGFLADKGVDREPLGSIQRAGCLKGEDDSFSYNWDRSFGGAMKTDAINAALFAVWWSGFLNGPIDLGSLLSGGGLPIPLNNLNAEMNFLMAPVISDCGPKGVLEAQVGDLWVDFEADLLGSPVHAEMYVDLAISLFFGASEEGLTVTVGDFRYLEVEIISYDSDPDALIDIRDLLENQLGSLLGDLVVGQSFGPIEIPEIAFADLVPGLPPEASIKLGNVTIDKSQGYVVLGADLE